MQYLCRSVASVSVRHGYAPKPTQSDLDWPRIREKQHKSTFLIRYPSVFNFNIFGAALRVCVIKQTKQKQRPKAGEIRA